VLAEIAQGNGDRMSSGFTGGGPDEEPGSEESINANASAVEAQAVFEATGHWGRASYGAAGTTWRVL
jgi:hypothetical protein